MKNSSSLLMLVLLVVSNGCGLPPVPSEEDRDEVRVERKLRFCIVFEGLSEDGLVTGPTTFFVDSEAGTYLLSLDRNCALVNAEALRSLPGFERLVQDGTSEATGSGSGPVFEATGIVRVRGTVANTTLMIAGKETMRLNASYVEHVDGQAVE